MERSLLNTGDKNTGRAVKRLRPFLAVGQYSGHGREAARDKHDTTFASETGRGRVKKINGNPVHNKLETLL